MSTEKMALNPAAEPAEPKPKRKRAAKKAVSLAPPESMEELGTCERCPSMVIERATGAVDPVRMMGSPASARVLLVADNPQIPEAVHGQPDWERDEWKVVSEALSAAEFTYEDVAITFATRCAVCRLSDKAKLLKSDVVWNCRAWLDLELAQAPNVTAIITLGRVATAAVLGVPLTHYTKAKGKIHEVQLGGRMVRVVVSAHPFQVVTTPFERESFELDFRQLRAVSDPDYQPFSMDSHMEAHAGTYHLVSTLPELKMMVDRLLEADMVAFDIESRGLDPFHLPRCEPEDATPTPPQFVTSIQFSPGPDEAYFVPVCHPALDVWKMDPAAREAWLGELRSFFTEYRGRRIAFNGKFDQVGILHDVGILPKITMDPMHVDQLRRGMPARSLKKLAWEVSPYGGYEESLKHPKEHKHDSYYYELDTLFWYGCTDVDVTWRAAEKHLKLTQLDGKLSWLSDFLANASGVLAEIECDGWRIDQQYLDQYGVTQLKKINDAKAQIRIEAAEAVALYERTTGETFEPTSSKALSLLLYELLGLQCHVQTEKGAPSTSREALKPLVDKHPIIPLLLTMRKAEKAYSAFYKRWKEGLAGDGKLHFHYNLIKFRDADTGDTGGTESGRLSSSGAAGNAQQITKDNEIRRTFLPDRDEDVLIDIDFSTLEYVVAAVYSRDPKLCEAFRKGFDIHAAVAAEMFGSTAEEMAKPENKKMRQKGKTMNFCVPIDTEILTREGWKTCFQVKQGEDVLAYDRESGFCNWTPMEAASLWRGQDLVEVANSHFRAITTPNHKWVSRRRTGRGNTRRVVEEMVESSAISSEHTIVRAAKAEGGPGLPISCTEAAVLAWLFTDGHVKFGKYTGSPSQAKGRKVAVVADIFQKKAKYVAELRELLAEVPYREYHRPTGIHVFRLQADYARGLFRRLGLTSRTFNWTEAVLQMSAGQRFSFLEAFWQAEGHTTNKGVRVLSQNEGPLLDAVRVAMLMEGHYPALRGNAKCKSVAFGKPTFTGQKVRVTHAGTGDVWCPTTKYGTFVAKQGDRMFITGNSSLYGAGPDNIASQLGCTVEEAEEFLKNYYAKFPGLFKWIQKQKKEVRKTGRAYSKMGRFRALPDASLPDTRMNRGKIEAALRRGVNGPIQGDASDICLWGLVRVSELIRECGLKTRLKATIHDAIILSSPVEEVEAVIEAVSEILTHPGLDWIEGTDSPGVPLRVSVALGPTWGEMEELNK